MMDEKEEASLPKYKLLKMCVLWGWGREEER